MKRPVSAVSLLLGCAVVCSAQSDARYDVVVVGGTPGGIASAVTAARLGHSVALAEYHAHLGGMSASGLGKSDIEKREMIAGFFTEFVGRVKAHYVSRYGARSENVELSRDGYFYEPSVAERIFDQLVAEQSAITVLKGHRLERATLEDGRITALTLVDRSTGQQKTLRGRVFVDATYEGDLFAAAGAKFRIGRESREEFGEPHAGQIYLDFRTSRVVGGSGAGDDRIPAYSFRLCLTSNPDNAAPLPGPPPDYDRTRYLGYLDDGRSGRFPGQPVTRIALTIAPLPNAKTDVNMNPRGLGFVFAEANAGYPDGSWQQREQIVGRLRKLTLGLLWFLQNDPELEDDSRALARRYHLARDEFTDNGHFPFQLYVREARRLVGAYTLSERNVTEQPGLRSERRQGDAIAVGEFPVDSFPVRTRQPGDAVALEGYLGMLRGITRPYQIPYRIMVPERLNGLLVPVAASTTHVAFSSIRLEPTWMAMGQAAGVAAHLAIEHGRELREAPIDELQSLLRKQGAVIDLPSGVE